MKYRIILSLALLAILAFAVVISSDHTDGDAVQPSTAPAANQPNFNL